MRVARHYSELIVWQLADQLRFVVYPLTKRPRFRDDARLRIQAEDAIESVCRNTAEGFAGSHAQFRNYLLLAKGSLNELCDSLRSAAIKEYVGPDDLTAVWAITRRLYPAMQSLIRHLETTDDAGRPLDHSTNQHRTTNRRRSNHRRRE
jgi:four helix bundle protein